MISLTLAIIFSLMNLNCKAFGPQYKASANVKPDDDADHFLISSYKTSAKMTCL